MKRKIKADLGCFHILATNSTAINSRVLISFDYSFVYIRPIMGLLGHMVNLLLERHTDYTSHFFPTNSVGGLSFLHTLSRNLLLVDFFF